MIAASVAAKNAPFESQTPMQRMASVDEMVGELMDEIKVLLQYAFQTENALTLPVSAPGSAGMEACFANLLEPGDTIIVCENGVFGGRMRAISERLGAKVVTVQDPWGRAVDPQKVEDALKAHPEASVLAFVHAEASTGALSDGTMGVGMTLHIGSSMLAYAVLTLAAIQSAVIAVQDHQLKHRHTRGIIQVLPPLQLMETILFELLWVGEILLSIAILSGFVFLDDIFAQQLVHKTVLTLVAWILFSVLLWGHYRLGWRSQTAVRLTIGGFLVLVLAFFGSKLVLELVLHRG